jgi:hypothetical protein
MILQDLSFLSLVPDEREKTQSICCKNQLLHFECKDVAKYKAIIQIIVEVTILNKLHIVKDDWYFPAFFRKAGKRFCSIL